MWSIVIEVQQEFNMMSYFFPYNIQHCFICRPSDSTVPTDAGIEPSTVTGALAARRSNHQARSHPRLGQISSTDEIKPSADEIFIYYQPSFSNTLQRKSHLCIPFLGIVQPQSQFPHSFVCERFTSSQNWSTYFLLQNRQIKRGNI